MRGERDATAIMGEGLSMEESRDADRLVEASGSRVRSGVDADCLDAFLRNLPDASLGGSRFGMQVVTQGDQRLGGNR